MYQEIIGALWFIFPAYFANSMAINTSGIPLLNKYSTPIDFGKKWQGKRILGNGKTWRGLIAGVASGTFIGYLQLSYQHSFPPYLPQMTVQLAFLLGLGAMTGDLVGSFLKRRTGLDRGTAVPFLDQLDYIIGAFLFAWLVVPNDISLLVVVVIITLPLHILSNVFAWAIGLKEVPW